VSIGVRSFSSAGRAETIGRGQLAANLAVNFLLGLYRFVATVGVSHLQRNLQRILSGPQMAVSCRQLDFSIFPS
jgi:hypothetical protein